MDSTGAQVVAYTYDAWGRPLSTTGSLATTLGLYNPLRYRGYVYDRESGLYYLQSRYYNPSWGRFLNADKYVSTGNGLVGYNMFAYCNNNPVMFSDPTGDIGILAILGIMAVTTLFLSIPSSEQQQPTNDQIKAAEEAAKRAEYTFGTDSAGNQTIHIHIDTKDALDTVDPIARDHYYQSLYNNSVQHATANNIPVQNLMSRWHITWEFELHALAYHLGFEAALVTDLDSDETPWSMFKRAIGW